MRFIGPHVRVKGLRKESLANFYRFLYLLMYGTWVAIEFQLIFHDHLSWRWWSSLIIRVLIVTFFFYKAFVSIRKAEINATE